MNLWIDDIRAMPTVYTGDDDWAQTSIHAINFIRARNEQGITYDEISFDHDLGGDDTSRAVMLWLIEHNVWPKRIFVHTANPVGRKWLVEMAERYAPRSTDIRY